MSLNKEKMEQLFSDLYGIIETLKGNDIAVLDNNLKATLKNIKELLETGSQRISEPTQADKDRIAGEIKNQIIESITSQEVIKQLKIKLGIE